MGPYSALFRCQEDYGGIWCTVLCGSDRPARRSDSTSFLILPPNPIKLNKTITAIKIPNSFIVFMCMWQKGKYMPQYTEDAFFFFLSHFLPA